MLSSWWSIWLVACERLRQRDRWRMRERARERERERERERGRAVRGWEGMEGGFTPSAVFTLEAYCCCWQLLTHSLLPSLPLFSRYSQLCGEAYKQAFPQRPLCKSRVYLMGAFEEQHTTVLLWNRTLSRWSGGNRILQRLNLEKSHLEIQMVKVPWGSVRTGCSTLQINWCSTSSQLTSPFHNTWMPDKAELWAVRIDH